MNKQYGIKVAQNGYAVSLYENNMAKDYIFEHLEDLITWFRADLETNQATIQSAKEVVANG